MGSRGHRGRSSRGQPRDIRAWSRGGGLPMVPQYFIISRDVRGLARVCIFIRASARSRSISPTPCVSTRALRHATPGCCAYTSPIKCRINSVALHILGPGETASKRFLAGEDGEGRWYFGSWMKGGTGEDSTDSLFAKKGLRHGGNKTKRRNEEEESERQTRSEPAPS